MAKSKSAKYFCENCGAEVAAKARFCPHCGRFFSAVRCPKCGQMGSVMAFKSGCPRCHYAMTPEDIYGPDGVPDALKDKKSKQKRKEKKKSKAASKGARSALGDDAPLWLYIVSIILLVFALGAIFHRCGVL